MHDQMTGCTSAATCLVGTENIEAGSKPSSRHKHSLSRSDFIILWRIFKQPGPLYLCDVSYEDLVRRFQDLMEDHKVCFAVLAR